MDDALLTINAGSSSIKFALFISVPGGALRQTVSGQVEGIGARPHLVAHDANGALLEERQWPDSGEATHEDVFARLFGWIEDHLGHVDLIGVGHRVVHGGRDLVAPVRLTPAVFEQLEALVPLAPLHQPHSLSAIRAVTGLRADMPQVACFDTAFHQTQPPLVRRYALPHDLSDSGIEKYGFHGLSYEYVAGVLKRTMPDLAAGCVVVAHLGNGASLCGLRGGQSVDTTMGFTTLDGLPMGTRCGAIDPGVILYLQQARGLSVAAVEDLLYHRCGLLGVSGVSADMRALLASDDPRAAEAVELFGFRVARETLALTAALGGLDGIVFTAGIGEHTPEIRALACSYLAWLGVRLDPAANARGERRISAADSRVTVLVISTDEEAMIAHHTAAVLR